MGRRQFLLVPAAALLLQACVPGRITLPQSPVLKWLERKSGHIAYVGMDGNILVMDQAGGEQRSVTTDAAVDENNAGPSFFYMFPAWAPSGRSLAFVSVRRTSDAVQDTGVWTCDQGSSPVRVYASDQKVPHHLSWAPDSSRLVFVTGLPEEGAQLQTVSARGGDVRVLQQGSGFAWRWETRGPRLAVHTVSAASGRLVEAVSILDSQGAGEQDLTQKLGHFDAPAWSSDGRVIMAVSDGMGSILSMEDPGGIQGRALAHVDGTAIMELSPDGRRLAWAASPTAGDLADRTLYVLDLQTGTPRALSGADSVAAFFWSPDGRRIAYFVPSGTDQTDQTVTLKVLTVTTGAVRTVTSFLPSPFFLTVLNEFGQYAESVRLWSPDSRYLLYCAMVPDSFDIMMAYADQPIAPRKIGDGMMATWSPR
jgi:Tol biopolymer transport system component